MNENYQILTAIPEFDDKNSMQYRDLSDKIIKAFFNVYNQLGYGFLEKIYERALVLELHELGISAKAQQQLKVFYKTIEVGDYFADVIVNDLIIVEIKAIDSLHDVHKRQLINYLKATNIEVGLLLNFGPKPQIVRQVFSNSEK